jgi:hypothetical protein
MGLVEGAVWIGASASAHATTGGIESAAPAADLRLVLPRCGFAVLRLLPPSTVVSSKGVVRFRSLDGSAPGRQVAFVNHDAPIRIRMDLPEGRWAATIDVEGLAEVERDFQTTRGVETSLDVALDVGATLAGRVQDLSGRPIEDGEVSWRSRRTYLGKDGRFSFEHVSREPAVLSVRAKGFLDGWMDTGAVEGVVVTLRRGGELIALIRDADGKSTQDFGVTIVDPEKPDAWKHDEPTVRANGRFESRLPEGRWRVRFWREDKIVLEQDVELREGEKTPVEFEMPR